MAQATEPALFLDTSIHIARLVHGPQTKQRIEERVAKHLTTETGLIARQEFKRRLLKEADYLLRLLERYGSFGEVQQHIIRLGSSPYHGRKQTICLQSLAQLHGNNDEECTKRLKLYLRSLLVNGLRQFDQSVDVVRRESNCACACTEVVEKKPLRKYEFGTDQCSKTKPGQCGIVPFLANNRALCKQILQKLESLPSEDKSDELKRAETFLRTMLGQASANPQASDPCLTVGDLMIALESANTPIFFTLNSVESQHLCRALQQTLIVQPIDPTKGEIVCSKDDANWPKFGKAAKDK